MGRKILRTVCMERVFDLHRLARKDDRYTLFSFESRGRRHFGIQIEGWPDIRDGMTVTALMDDEMEWNGLFGWFDHDAEVWYLPSMGKRMFSCVMALALAGFSLAEGAAREHGSLWHIGSAALVVLAVMTLHAMLSVLIDRRRLRAGVEALGRCGQQ